MEENGGETGVKKKRVKRKILKKKTKGPEESGVGGVLLLRPQDQTNESKSLPGSRRSSIKEELMGDHHPVAGVRRRSSGVPEELPIFIREEVKTVEEKMTAAKRERLGKVVELLTKPSRSAQKSFAWDRVAAETKESKK